MGIPNKVSPLTGGGSILPRGYLPAEFLESTGATEKMTITCPPQPYTKWQLETVHAVKQVTIQGKTQQEGINDGTNSFQWATYSYLSSNSVWIQNFFLRGGGKNNNLEMGKYDVWGDFKRIMIYITPTARGGTINGVPYEGESASFTINANTISLWGTSGGSHLMPGKKKTWKLLVDDKPVYDMTAALDQQGVPCMYDRVSKQAIYNSSTGQFIAGFTLAQALNLRKLPVTENGTLTVSLPYDAQLVITGVPAALQVAADKGWTITVQYQEQEEDSVLNTKYAACETVADVQAVNADYKSDVTADGEWLYQLPLLTNAYEMFWHSPKGILNVFRGKMPSVTNVQRMFKASWVKEIICDFPNLEENVSEFFGDYSNFWRFKGALPALRNGGMMFWNAGSMTTFESDLTALTSGASMFDRTKLNKESVLRILGSIPTYTSGSHPLTIGIHVDLQTNEDIINAIADAEAKGWTLTVQWNGTATAEASVSTYGLRRRNPVYAKLGEPLEDGTPVLDWGHYVTDPSGYQEFASLEEAEEYFNINQTAEA